MRCLMARLALTSSPPWGCSAAFGRAPQRARDPSRLAGASAQGLRGGAWTNLIQRYEELVSLHVLDRPRRYPSDWLAQGPARCWPSTGLQPDVGHEVLWVIRECLSGEVLAGRGPLLSATRIRPWLRCSAKFCRLFAGSQ